MPVPLVVSRVPPPPVFCEKSLDLIDNKGVEFFGDDKELVIDCDRRTYAFRRRYFDASGQREAWFGAAEERHWRREALNWQLGTASDDHGLGYSGGGLVTTVRRGKKGSGVLFCC